MMLLLRAAAALLLLAAPAFAQTLACQAGAHRRALPGRRLGRHPVPPGG
jgi:hypothetical protein